MQKLNNIIAKLCLILVI